MEPYQKGYQVMKIRRLEAFRESVRVLDGDAGRGSRRKERQQVKLQKAAVEACNGIPEETANY